jgi:hypothetical protein
MIVEFDVSDEVLVGENLRCRQRAKAPGTQSVTNTKRPVVGLNLLEDEKALVKHLRLELELAEAQERWKVMQYPF